MKGYTDNHRHELGDNPITKEVTTSFMWMSNLMGGECPYTWSTYAHNRKRRRQIVQRALRAAGWRR